MMQVMQLLTVNTPGTKAAVLRGVEVMLFGRFFWRWLGVTRSTDIPYHVVRGFSAVGKKTIRINPHWEGYLRCGKPTT